MKRFYLKKSKKNSILKHYSNNFNENYEKRRTFKL